MFNSRPQISVIVPTYKRERHLPACLDSLARQQLASSAFEVIVVDDDPSDQVEEICRRSEDCLRIQYLRQEHAGLAVAKNLGIDHARAPLVLFFDDDDVADERMLVTHVLAHQRYRSDRIAVLGNTSWHPSLEINAVMDYVVHRGFFLFCYPLLRHGQSLDYTFFWGGRSSCKRDFLLQNGLFEPGFGFGCEDIELGKRLSKVGLSVRYDSSAKSFMMRSLGFDEFCMRCERQGQSLHRYASLYNDEDVSRYCMTDIVEAAWEVAGPAIASQTKGVRQKVASAVGPTPSLDRDLWWCFMAHRFKGIVEARQGASWPCDHRRLDSPVVEALRRYLEDTAC